MKTLHPLIKTLMYLFTIGLIFSVAYGVRAGGISHSGSVSTVNGLSVISLLCFGLPSVFFGLLSFMIYRQR